MSQCALICISLVISNRWALFIYLLFICVLSLETSPWSLVSIIYLGSLFSYCWVTWAPYMLWVLTTCMTCSLRILPPIPSVAMVASLLIGSLDVWIFSLLSFPLVLFCACVSGHKTVIPIPMCIWPALIGLSGLCWVWREEDKELGGKLEWWSGWSWGIAGVNLIRTHIDIRNSSRIGT